MVRDVQLYNEQVVRKPVNCPVCKRTLFKCKCNARIDDMITKCPSCKEFLSVRVDTIGKIQVETVEKE